MNQEAAVLARIDVMARGRRLGRIDDAAMPGTGENGGQEGSAAWRSTPPATPPGRSPSRAISLMRSLLMFLAAFLAVPAALASTTPPAEAPKPGAASTKPAAAAKRYQPDRFAGKAGRYYRLVWGVDSLSVKLAESGELVRFSWRVVDPAKAALLSDKKLTPALEDPQAGVSLVVPAMEKVGQLRQSVAPEIGRTYWMAFSNKGRMVKRGARVSVVIGQFRADGLVVD